MRRFPGGGLPEGASELSFEQTLEALLGLVGRPVLVLFSGVAASPFIAGNEFERGFWQGEEQLVSNSATAW